MPTTPAGIVASPASPPAGLVSQIVTVDPLAWRVPAAGTVFATTHCAHSTVQVPRSYLASNPLPDSRSRAGNFVIPTALDGMTTVTGSGAGSGPRETTRATVSSRCPADPPAGSWALTTPAGTSGL